MRKRKEVQEVLRSYYLAICWLLSCAVLAAAGADSTAVWKEYGLLDQQSHTLGKQSITTYRMKDLTGALAAWQWLRSPQAHPCNLTAFCTEDGTRTILQDGNYLITIDGGRPTAAEAADLLASLPNKRNTSLPAILTFLPAKGRVPNSGRYLLGSSSLGAFASPLSVAKPGFEQGAEAQIAQYKLDSGAPVNLAVFYYPTPEMARLHVVNFKSSVGPHVKRSGVLVAMVYGPAADSRAETLLSRVQYEAKITWNEVPPPSPIKPLYRLLTDILYISSLLCLLALAAGLFYAGMRLYRRRYGTLDAQEAMTTLNIGGE